MMNLDDVLHKWIPYRLQAMETMMWAYYKQDDIEPPKEIVVTVDGEKILQGYASAIFNPMLEVGFIHARSLLEFMGLAASEGRLVAVKGRRKDDIAIEQFSVNGVALEKVSPSMALDTYTGPRDLGERALVAMFELANKGLAHLTSGIPDGYTSEDLEIACKGIKALVGNNLYIKLGMQIPEPQKRDG
ncbi:MAG: hypothetical protein BGP10_15165 [Rhodanobacter sp. 68-29]|nr:hypothetical protein [Rhodanobacter sp.]ODU72617.1 MAG: hypothetical protein ABT17_14610 [Rhodanobacter sp. SCN 69-32]OJY61260.1 MAG: hypothetical protein BGP10_15165 [Rhodanobacter sp. 68-29]